MVKKKCKLGYSNYYSNYFVNTWFIIKFLIIDTTIQCEQPKIIHILLAYIIAIPANEIVIPTILMLTVLVTGVSISESQGAGVLFDLNNQSTLLQLLSAGGWSVITAVCLMIFSLCHNPCSTTIYTIYKETRSVKWTITAVILPLVFGFALCGFVNLVLSHFSEVFQITNHL